MERFLDLQVSSLAHFFRGWMEVVVFLGRGKTGRRKGKNK